MSRSCSGEPLENQFEVNAKLVAAPGQAGVMRVDRDDGKQATDAVYRAGNFFARGYALLQCEPLAERTHQVRVHASHVGLKIVGDEIYGGKPLWLSRLKKDYRAQAWTRGTAVAGPRRPARGGIEPAASGHRRKGFHEKRRWPKDLKVALKYLRSARFAVAASLQLAAIG